MTTDVPRVGEGPRPTSIRPPVISPEVPEHSPGFRRYPVEKPLAADAEVSSYWWVPTNYSFGELGDIRLRDTGTKVAALQTNLGAIAVDGSFGDSTRKRVKQWQRVHGLGDDGVAGYKTQRSIAVARSQAAATEHGTPPGFLKGKIQQESNFYLAAFSQHPSDWGYDIGAYQESIGPYGDPDDQFHFELGYTVSRMADLAASSAKAEHDRLSDDYWVVHEGWYGDAMQIGSTYRPWVYAWQLAALSWNWPSAVFNLSHSGTVYKTAGMDDAYQQWIVTASGGRLTTARQWVLEYMTKATAFCSFG